MKLLLLVSVALVMALPMSCKSHGNAAPCTCGAPLTDVEGCAHKLCLSGKHNPDNPSCVCGTIPMSSKETK